MTINLLAFWLFCFATSSVLGTAPPKITPLLFPDDQQEGMTARVSCTAYAGDPPLDFRWLKDGDEMSPDLPSMVRQLDDFTSSLILGPLSQSHVGNYTCIVSNAAGTDRSTARLFVKVAPKWLVQPSDMTIKNGQFVSLPCSASGSPKPQVTWSKKDVTATSNHRWRTAENGSFVISHSEKEDSGIYTCLVTNGVGSPLEKTVHLSVWNPPRIKKKFYTESVEKNKEILIVCEASGDQPLFFMWTKDGADLSQKGQLVQRINREDNVDKEGGSSKLFITNTQTSDSGTFSCTVSNDAGNDTMNARLIVTERPERPTDLEVSEFWSRNVRVRWTMPYSGSSPILHYVVEFWDVSDPAGQHRNVSVPAVVTSAVLQNLQPASNYRLRLFAVNAVGISPPSDQIMFSTSEEEPSGPPLEVRVEKTGATFVRVAWKPPARRHWNGVIQGYYVGYKAIDSSAPYSFFTAASSNKSGSYILRGLQKSTGYFIVVKAFNTVGTGPLSSVVSVRTREGEAPLHPLVTVMNVGPTSIQLRGTVISDEFMITGFTVYYKSDRSDEWQEIAVSKTAENNIFLENLEPGVLYQMYIIAQSPFGDSEPSETVTIRTSPLQVAQEKEEIKQADENAVLTQTLYIIIPVIAATIIIITIVIAACLYVHYKKPPLLAQYPTDLQKDIAMSYSATLRRKEFGSPSHHDSYDCVERGPHWSGVPTAKSTDSAVSLEEEPIYECVMDEMRHVMMQRGHATLRKPMPGVLC